jgi:hypothetical protein
MMAASTRHAHDRIHRPMRRPLEIGATPVPLPASVELSEATQRDSFNQRPEPQLAHRLQA